MVGAGVGYSQPQGAVAVGHVTDVTRIGSPSRHQSCKVAGDAAVDCSSQCGFVDDVRHVGPGRGGPNRRKVTQRTVRYQITGVTRDEAAIERLVARMGWQAQVTNLASSRLSLGDCVLGYRAGTCVERAFSMITAGEDVLTYPCDEPACCLDHIAVSRHFRVERSWSVETDVSDHLPLVADLVLRTASATDDTDRTD